MAITLKPHERLVKVETKPRRAADGTPIKTPQMYIKVFETEGLSDGEILVEAGSEAIRAPDGTPLPAVVLYEKADASTVDSVAGITTGESGLYDDIAAVFGCKFKEYVDGVEDNNGYSVGVTAPQYNEYRAKRNAEASSIKRHITKGAANEQKI